MALKKCKECAGEVSTKAAACPSCGAVQKKRHRLLGAVVAVLGFFLLVGMIGSLSSGPSPSDKQVAASSSGHATTTPAQKPRESLEILDTGWGTSEYGGITVSGKVRNNTARQYHYVQVDINLYDTAGTQIGSTIANVNNLEPLGTWKFDAPVDPSVSSFRVKGVKAF